MLFCSSSVPLQPPSVWNPASDSLLQADIDFDIPSFFGVIPSDLLEDSVTLSSYELTRSQIFPAEEWVALAEQLQRAQARGEGIIARTSIATVANEYYGIPAGLQVDVAWVYLGRLSKWEQMLTPSLKV